LLELEEDVIGEEPPWSVSLRLVIKYWVGYEWDIARGGVSDRIGILLVCCCWSIDVSLVQGAGRMNVELN